MKRMKGLRHGYIAKSNYPTLDAMEREAKERTARLEKLIEEARKLTNS